MKDFLTRIQNSEEPVRKIWLFVFSAIAMVVVFGLWGVYMNLTIARVEPPAGSQPAVAKAPEIHSPGFGEIFAAGVKIIYDRVYAVVSDRVSVKRNILIENPKQNFVAESVVPIKPVILK